MLLDEEHVITVDDTHLVSCTCGWSYQCTNAVFTPAVVSRHTYMTKPGTAPK